VTLVTLPLIIDVSHARDTSIWGGSVTSVTGLVLRPFPHLATQSREIIETATP
jgi:hypothetical protein